MPPPNTPENYNGELVKWRNRAVHSRRSYFGQIVYQPGGYCGWRVQRDFQLVIIHSGECQVMVDDVPRELGIGRVHLFKPGRKELFTFSKRHETRHSWCCFSPKVIGRDMALALRKAPDDARLTPLFERVLGAALELGRGDDLTQATVLDHLALSLFAEFLHCGQEANRAKPMERPVVAAVRYMNDHFGDPDCLLGAGKVAACSRSALNRKFQEGLGDTPGRYLWNIRVEKGIGMLRTTGLTISEISDRCGFSNPYHFSRRIKAVTGLAPRSVRKTAWGR